MIESNLDSTRGQGHIVVCPNMSGQWRTTKLCLWIICCWAMLIAIAFSLLGAWLILPFAGLEVIALVSVMTWVAHQCRRKQVISIGDNRITVETGYLSPSSCWQAELFWTRLVIDKPPYPGHPYRIFLRSKDNKLELGEFLNEEDKQQLVTLLRGVISA